MDTQTWRHRLEQNQLRRTQKQKMLLLIGVFTVLLGTWLWYFFVYTRTPEYALQQLQKAVENKDADTFARYADLSSITSYAYDDLTVDFFADDKSLTEPTRKLFENFYVLIKPQVTAGTAETIRQRVASGEWTLPTGSSILKGRQLGIDYEHILERSQLRNTELTKIGAVTRDGNSAVALLEIRDSYTQTPFTLRLHLKQNDDGHWQADAILNYRLWLEKITALHNEDLASYIAATQPIVDKYNLVFKQQQTKFHTLVQTGNGRFSAAQASQIKDFLEKEVIPTLEKRQTALAAVPVPAGAQYLSLIRIQSTDVTIKAWQHFIAGVTKNQAAELDLAETLHKRELELDSRISTILKHTSHAQTLPEIP